jgi:uncharacterized protein
MPRIADAQRRAADVRLSFHPDQFVVPGRPSRSWVDSDYADDRRRGEGEGARGAAPAAMLKRAARAVGTGAVPAAGRAPAQRALQRVATQSSRCCGEGTRAARTVTRFNTEVTHMNSPAKSDRMNVLAKVLITIASIGAINWGLIGFFNFNLVDAIFGGGSAEQTSGASRVVYALVGLAGLLALVMLPRLREDTR